jgi:hypothetical protein
MEKGRTAQDRTTGTSVLHRCTNGSHREFREDAVESRVVRTGGRHGSGAGELFALRVETDVNLNEQTVTIRRSVFEGEENTSKSDTGDEDRTRTVPIDASVAMELKKHLRGRRYKCAGGQASKLQPVLRGLKLVQPGMGMHAFRRAGFLTCLFRGEPSGHSRLVRTFFGQDGRPLHEDVAPASRSRNGESEAVIGPKLECAGINRREVANARVVQVRRSEPTWPRVMRGQSQGCT